MQFSENWLRSLINPPLSRQALAERLTMSGLEVEEIRPVVATPFSGVVIGEVLTVAPHPNADRLRVCQVATGKDQPLTIVCGAPNVAVGIKVPCACVGASLPPVAGAAIEIRATVLRGLRSEGMLCAARELGLPETASPGLLILPQHAPVGRDFATYADIHDALWTLKLTPNRADCLSLLGIAREIAALTGATLHFPAYAPVASNSDEIFPVRILAPELCGQFAGRVIRNIMADAPTPVWMVQRLERAGLRSLSALVDISNYVMLECGQPTHIFDLEKLTGGLTIRWGKPNETVTLLDEKTVSLNEWVGVVADEVQVQALAGIMGAKNTAVSAKTQHVYLESAFWQPQAIAGRARHFHCSSQAAHRFERGVDFSRNIAALERLSQLILEICATENTTIGPVDHHCLQLPQRLPLTLRLARAESVLGLSLSPEEIRETWNRLGFTFEETAPAVFLVTPPAYRFDLEIEEDLIEEVARLKGFDTLPAQLPTTQITCPKLLENWRSFSVLRQSFAALDYQEVLNLSFVDPVWEADFSYRGQKTPIALKNPLSPQTSVLRTTLLGSLVANIQYNLDRKIQDIRIFELATVFFRDPDVITGDFSVAGIAQPHYIAGAAYGRAFPPQWGQSARAVDFFDIKADIERLFLPSPQRLRFVPPEVKTPFHPGRCAYMYAENNIIGMLGELHPALQQKYGLPQAPVLFELDTRFLQETVLPHYRPISKFPQVVRDLSLTVPQNMPAETLLQCLRTAAADIRHTVILFDQYLEKDRKNLAFRCTFFPEKHTLQECDIENLMAELLAAATALPEVICRTNPLLSAENV